jgi:hypothetical protein
VLFVEAPDALFAMGSQLPPVFAVENHPFLQVFRGTFPNVSADQRLDLLFDQLIFGMFQKAGFRFKTLFIGFGLRGKQRLEAAQAMSTNCSTSISS